MKRRQIVKQNQTKKNRLQKSCQFQVQKTNLKNWPLVFFFRPTPMALARSFIKPESQLHFAKFTELMQWQHHYDDNVHQKGELDGIDT